jgi:signal transduction histidine kinase
MSPDYSVSWELPGQFKTIPIFLPPGPKRYFYTMLRFLSGICMVCCFAVSATAQQLPFNIYTPADGLTDARVQKIFQDSRGLLYFITREGFCSFDGQRFQPYTQYQNQPISIVYDIIEEQNGELLISAITGLYRLQRNHLWKDTALSARLSEPGLIIAAGTGEWIILSNSGSYTYRNRQLQPLYITENGGTAPLQLDRAVSLGPFIAGLRTSPDNRQTQFIIFNRQLNTITHQSVSTRAMNLISTGDSLYIKTGSEWKELQVSSAGKATLLPVPFLAGTNATHFYSDRQHNKWIFYPDKTVSSYPHTSREKTTYEPANGLPPAVTSLFQDRELNYWFMVEGKGVYKLIRSGIREFNRPGISTAPAQSISNTGNTGVCIRKSNTLSILTGKQILQKKINPKPGLLQTIFFRGKWYALYDKGILETEDGKSIRLATFPEGTKQISSRISTDRNGRLLTGGDFLSVVEDDSLAASIPLPYFTDNIVADEQNNYWCFARNGTILAYTLSDRQLKQLAIYTDRSYSTRFALHWNKDSFCIGTRNNGIILVEASSAHYKKSAAISTADGLSNNFITGLLRIRHHQLAASTVTGLDLVHFSAGGISAEQLFSRIGLFTGVPGMTTLGDSTILALTDGGALYQLSTNLTSSSGSSLSLFFSSITVNGIAADPEKNIMYPYNRNNFRFAVSAPSFIDEKNIRFILSVNGENKNAAHDSRSGDFELSNLAPGNYTVSITALLPGYNSGNKTITYSFHIKKPFWKTAGFIVGLFALATLLLYGIFRSILRKKLERQKIDLEKQEAIARERTRIATDMHDDLGAGISTIKYLSQSAPFISAGIQKENNLKIAAQADDLVDKMNDIIWAMNEKNDTLDNLVFYTKAWVANYAEQHNLDATVNIPSTVPSTIIRGEKRQHIFLCIKEGVHNIIKHAGATRMWLNIEWTENKLHITIKDNGRGFDGKKAISGNGLANMQKRIQAINGLLKIESKEGTVLFLTIPV